MPGGRGCWSWWQSVNEVIELLGERDLIFIGVVIVGCLCGIYESLSFLCEREAVLAGCRLLLGVINAGGLGVIVRRAVQSRKAVGVQSRKRIHIFLFLFLFCPRLLYFLYRNYL